MTGRRYTVVVIPYGVASFGEECGCLFRTKESADEHARGLRADGHRAWVFDAAELAARRRADRILQAVK